MIFTINHYVYEVPPAGTGREKIEETFLSQPCCIKNDRTKNSAIFSTPVPVATGIKPMTLYSQVKGSTIARYQ
jgi:hypothetical protein